MAELAQPLPAANATNEREWLLRLLDHLTNVAIALLFFLHGAKLSREAAIAAASHWRLHALVLLTTFVLFQAALVATRNAHTLRRHLVPLPAASTVQSSIAFTAIATGNVPAAICSASVSSIIGIFVTPLVISVLHSSHVGSGSAYLTVGEIFLQLFVPLVCGRLLRPLIGGWLSATRASSAELTKALSCLSSIQLSARQSAKAYGVRFRLRRWPGCSSPMACFSPPF